MQMADSRVRSRRYAKDCVNYVHIITKSLFRDRGTTRDFREAMALKRKTGNSEDIINVIRKRLHIPGVRGNIVPSNTTIYGSAASFKYYFVALLHPESTFSGFRVDLVAYVKLAAYLLLGRKDISGLAVDVWGDSCEIGGKEVTRFVFRILSELPGNLSSQSANAAFNFAAYYGKFLHLYIMRSFILDQIQTNFD
jgi:hypothetical protein